MTYLSLKLTSIPEAYYELILIIGSHDTFAIVLCADNTCRVVARAPLKILNGGSDLSLQNLTS